MSSSIDGFNNCSRAPETHFGTSPGASDRPATDQREGHFFQQLVGNMKDGVVFTDAEGTIRKWNPVMERLTSIASDAIVGQTWSNECVRLRDQDGERSDTVCFVQDCLASGTVISRPMLIEQPGEEPTPVHVQVSPVIGATPGIHGTVVIIRDLSDQTIMEEQLESLHQQTTRDPLTGVANRAHFDRFLEELTGQDRSGWPQL